MLLFLSSPFDGNSTSCRTSTRNVPLHYFTISLSTSPCFKTLHRRHSFALRRILEVAPPSLVFDDAPTRERSLVGASPSNISDTHPLAGSPKHPPRSQSNSVLCIAVSRTLFGFVSLHVPHIPLSLTHV